jgi:hypothetical protein
LTALCGFADWGDFQSAHRQWVEQALENGLAVRDDRWSEAIAVGSLAFVESVKSDLGGRVFDFTLGTHLITTKGTTELGGAKRRSAIDLYLH